jgi:hypothetical protein
MNNLTQALFQYHTMTNFFHKTNKHFGINICMLSNSNKFQFNMSSYRKNILLITTYRGTFDNFIYVQINISLGMRVGGGV